MVIITEINNSIGFIEVIINSIGYIEVTINNNNNNFNVI